MRLTLPGTLTKTLLIILNFCQNIFSLDVFCGNLTVYEQQRFGENSFVISSQATTDLKQCLELCCSIINCEGVTLLGIITARPGEPNCQLVGCKGGKCQLNERSQFADGLLSVVLARQPSTSSVPPTEANVTDLFGVVEGEETTTIEPLGTPSEPPSLSHALAPVWAVGLAIVVAVACLGLNLGLLSAYICYRRQKNRKQTAQISQVKAPTLHAFNPTY